MAMREKASEIFEDPEFHEQDFNVTAKERLMVLASPTHTLPAHCCSSCDHVICPSLPVLIAVLLIAPLISRLIVARNAEHIMINLPTESTINPRYHYRRCLRRSSSR